MRSGTKAASRSGGLSWVTWYGSDTFASSGRDHPLKEYPILAGLGDRPHSGPFDLTLDAKEGYESEMVTTISATTLLEPRLVHVPCET